MSNQSRYGYEAIAQFSGKNAGFVCEAQTKDECAKRARAMTKMTIRIRRARYTSEAYAALKDAHDLGIASRI
jgi:hypothetical protein